MTLERLREEYSAGAGLGPEQLKLLGRVTKAVATRLPARPYAGSGAWTEAELEDVLSEWVTTRLLGRGDYERMLLAAKNMRDLRGGLQRSLYQHLINKRAKGRAVAHARRVIATLRERFGQVPALGTPQGWTLPGGSEEIVAGRPSELMPAVAPYDGSNPGPAIERLLTRARGAVDQETIIDVLRRCAGLPEHEEPELGESPAWETVSSDPPDARLSTAEIQDAASAVLARLAPEQIATLQAFHAEPSVPSVAKSLGTAESTIRRRLRAVVALLADAVDAPGISSGHSFADVDVVDDVWAAYDVLITLMPPPP